MICKAGCPSLIFDGRGRWIRRDKWKPFSQGKVNKMSLLGLVDDY